ncbi:MAG: response regulator [Lewinellaceae bacterium]|nr:response regulator [Lewinellaceae bacterium]
MFWTTGAVAQTDYRVERYTALNGLEKAHWVNDVQMDATGMIWLVLNQGGLARFDGDVFTYYSLPTEWQKDFKELVMQKLVIDQSGKFWVNGLGKILFFDPATGNFTMPDDIGGLPNSNIAALRQTRSGALVFFSNDNLYCRRRDDDKFQLMGHISLSKESSIETTDTEENERGELWVATLKGFYRHVQGNPELALTGFSNTEGNPFPAGNQPLPTASSTARPAFCGILMSPHTVKKVNMRGEIAEQYEMPEFKHLFSVLETGDLRWFGVFDGLVKVSRRNRFFQRWLDQPFDLSQGPPTGNSCYGLTESPDGFIYTASDLSLYEISPLQPGKSRVVREMPVSFRRYGMMTDREGNIWLSRYGYNADCFNPKTRTQRRIPFDVSNGLSNSLLQDKTGLIWVACENGIVRIDPRTFTASNFPLPEKTYVWHFYQSDDNTIWAATKNGILKINSVSGEVRQFNPANTAGMASGEILSIHEAEGFLWCGSTGGLIRFNPKTNAAFTFSTRHGLPHNHVYAAIPAEGSLWLPTNKGLARVSLDSVKKTDADLADVDIFGADDGLPHHEFNTLTFLKAKNGMIWLGGLNGIVAFDPKKLVLSKSADKSVIIAEFSKYDQKADSVLSFPRFKDHWPDAFILRPEEKFFSVRFALLDYRDPKANQYSYKLEGFDPDWVFAGNQNTARYANLPPGEYTLRIRGANPNGIWSNREAMAVIVVQQVWYKTAWAWVFYTLLTAGIIFSAWRSRMRRLRLSQQLEMEHLRSENLKELEAFKSRFFTNITHEFRTPLTVVLGMSDQLHSALEVAGARGSRPDISVLLSLTALIQRGGENLLQLVNQILDLAKLESNSLKINYIQGDVLAFVRYVCESLHSLAETRNIRLEVKSGAAEIVMDYDPERLQQIVHNLLSNAIKFTPEGGKVLLTLDFPGFQNLESLLVIRVTDTGTGIPPETLPFVFDRFFQAGNQEYTGAAGSGIGLSLTKELVKAMGGEISVQSGVGQGTIFTVRLPVSNKAEKATALTDERGFLTSFESVVNLPETEGRRPETNNRILLIEDNPDVMEYLAACLRDRYVLDFAYDGQSGIEKALATVPDLIISDVMMPGKNGFEVCEILKNDERSSHIPLVLLTAKADIDSRLAGLRRGADAYLAKPFHPEELLLTLNNLLELRRQMQARYLDWATQEIPVSETASTAAPTRKMSF